MATIVHATGANNTSQQLIGAINQIRQGIATLRTLQGLNSAAIGVSAAEFEAVFGIQSGNGQAMSDRMSNFIDVLYNPSSGAYGDFVYLRDLIEPFTVV